MKKGGVIRMEKLKPMSKTFTLTRRDSGRLKQSSYQVCKDEKFYYFSSIGGVAFFIAEFIKPRSNDDLITITVESTNLKQEDSCHANEILFWFYTEVGFRMHIYLVLCTFQKLIEEGEVFKVLPRKICLGGKHEGLNNCCWKRWQIWRFN